MLMSGASCSTGPATWWRRQKKSLPVARFEVEPTVRDTADEVVRRAELLQALLALPFRQRATVVLRYLEGLSERETAGVLGCSEGTVKSQSARGPSALRTFLSRTETTL